MKAPNEEEFFEFFNDVFPKGNPQRAHNEVIYHIHFRKMFGSKAPVTWDIIKMTFTKYIEKRREEEFEEKYIKSIESFVKNGDYNMNFDNEPDMKRRDQFQTGMNESYSEIEQRLGKGGSDG